MWWLPMALAAGATADTELVRPSITGGPAWVALAAQQPVETWRYGVLLQYENTPVLLHKYSQEVGAVVLHRQVMHAGLRYQGSERMSFGLTVPVYLHWGSEVPELEGDGAGWGDVALEAMWALNPVGLRVQAIAPTARRDHWMGGQAALSMSALAGPPGRIGPAFEGGITLRQAPDVAPRMDQGTEAFLNLALVARGDRLHWASGCTARASIGSLKERTRPPAECLTEVGLQAGRFDWSVGGGRGVGWGAGTTDLRITAGVTTTWRKPEHVPLEPFVARIELPPEPAPEVVVTPIPEPDVALAIIDGDQIVISEPIQFEFATSNILPESAPVLEAVAEVMNTNAQLVHVVIEGHASEEGSYAYNYELSVDRARSIWEALVDRGVHPERISYRGMGEVRPTDAELAPNRRAEFHIVLQLEVWEETPSYGATEIDKPWDGEQTLLVTPTMPEVESVIEEAPDAEEPLDPEAFLEDLEEAQ